ncbi:MAG: uroporphyrinogen-III synthase [Hyphomicrobiales bacterium]
MVLLVTRPSADAVPLAVELEGRGLKPLIHPLLDIRVNAEAPIRERDYQAVVITSASGVRALWDNPAFRQLRPLPLIAVGRASGVAAKEAGFADVSDAGGDLADLGRLVAERCNPEDGPLLYPAGAVVSGDLKGVLEKQGFTVERVTVYEAVQADALSETAQNFLKNGTLNGVLLYSPRTARIWARLADAAELKREALGIVHYCLSQAVADALEQAFGQAPGSVVVAERPNQDALIALIEGP